LAVAPSVIKLYHVPTIPGLFAFGILVVVMGSHFVAFVLEAVVRFELLWPLDVTASVCCVVSGWKGKRELGKSTLLIIQQNLKFMPGPFQSALRPC